MIACAASAIGNAKDEGETRSGDNIAIIEGSTGVGKSVGYLVPSLAMAVALDKKLIISSATVALQEQLIDRDLPAVLNLFPDKNKISVVLAKGRNRYACVTKLRQITNTSESSDFFGAVWDRPPRADETATLFRVSAAFDKGWTGDRDALPFTVDEDLWYRITNDNSGCPGNNCDDKDSCPFLKSRISLRSANVIVANHDFILTSLAAESKSMPSPDDSIMVFDEAHHLPEIAVRRFAASHSLKGAISWLQKLVVVNNKVTLTTKDNAVAEELNASVKNLLVYLMDFQSALEHSPFFEKESIYRFPHGQLDQNMASVAESISKAAKSTFESLKKVIGLINEVRSEGSVAPAITNKLQSDLGFFVSRMENVCQTWDLFSKSGSVPPLAKWIELKDEDYLISASPLSAADMLSNILWNSASAVILTSATMTSLGDFRYYLEKTGLNKFPDTQLLDVKSPFNFREQGQIYLPKLKSDPKDALAHTHEIVTLMPNILSEFRGSLVLFASRKQMTAVYEALEDAGQANNILMQGQHPKREILRLHAELIKCGQPSAVFGLVSFGEGVDLPGDLCEQVVITKIPFAPPDSPIEKAMQEWVESRGGNAFVEVSLPKAGLLLTQWAGRLIRSETDRGRVVFLDRRMIASSYKNRLLAGLPDFTLVYG